MVRKILKNKPLIEAIFELKWELKEQTNGIKIDPHYKVLIGSVYDKVKNEYPFHEQLPASTMPDEIASYVVQHRFRKNKDEWPLIQIGPGIITLNDTVNYKWKDFKERILIILKTLFETYPDAKNNLKVNGLLLRYIDALEFDFEKNAIFPFLKNQMKMNIEIYDKLFESTGVSKSSPGFDLKFSFQSLNPKGTIHLRLARGKKNIEDVLIWETMVKSDGYDDFNDKKRISKWANDAHSLAGNWFFKIIGGELLRRFE